MSGITEMLNIDSLKIRWLKEIDMEEIVEIENHSFPNPWTEKEFTACLKQKNIIGSVAELDSTVVGFMVYELKKYQIRLLSIAVDDTKRRQGIGKEMIDRTIDKLKHTKRRVISTYVSEYNLNAQLFFQKHEFRAISVVKKHYDDADEDAYLFQYRL